MVEKIIGALTLFVIGVIRAGGYGGVVLLMAIESACIPLPSELVMPFAGYLVSTGEMNLFWAATAGAIGCNLGSIVAYEIGKRGGRPLAERWGKYLLIGPGELDMAGAIAPRHAPRATHNATRLYCLAFILLSPSGEMVGKIERGQGARVSGATCHLKS